MNINLISVCNQLGYGVAGSNILKALSANGHHVAFWPLGQIEALRDDHELIKKCITNSHFYDVDAPSIRLWHQFALDLFPGHGLRIGFPIFELDKFTDLERHQLRNLDCLFVCSKWAQNVLTENGIIVPSYVVPLGVDKNIFFADSLPHDYDKTMFFNCGKWEIRKGHDIIVEAFNKAFCETDNVNLVMNCSNPFIGEAGNKDWINLYRNSKLGNKITIMENRFNTQQELALTMSSVDCGIFPARAEGWNLELLEMMACNKPVITTNCTGHTEYVSKENSFLIEVDQKEEAYDGVFFNGQGNWYKLESKHVDQLAEYMRHIHKNKVRGNPEGLATAERFSWQNTATQIEKALSDYGFQERPTSGQ